MIQSSIMTGRKIDLEPKTVTFVGKTAELQQFEGNVYAITGRCLPYNIADLNEPFWALDGVDVAKCLAHIRQGGQTIEQVLKLPTETGEVLDIVVLAKMPQVRGEVDA